MQRLPRHHATAPWQRQRPRRRLPGVRGDAVHTHHHDHHDDDHHDDDHDDVHHHHHHDDDHDDVHHHHHHHHVDHHHHDMPRVLRTLPNGRRLHFHSR